VDDDPDPASANALQEGLGGQFSEMRTMMQYLFQAFNFRGTATPYKDLIQGIGVEEISHVELIATTISKLLDGAPGFKPNGVPGEGGSTPRATPGPARTSTTAATSCSICCTTSCSRQRAGCRSAASTR
jgi:Mn-containing catalase